MATEASREPIVRPNRPASAFVLPTFAAVLIGLLLVWLIVNFVKQPADFMTVFFIGLTNGAVYALIALGYTLVYGILELINFPHGEVFRVALGGSEIVYTWNKLIVVIITVPVLLALMWLVRSTKQGKAMRATAQDKDAAAMMGINVNRTISFTFLIAGALAGAAGLLYALYFGQIRYDTGFSSGLIAFTAAVLGGIGNLPGAVLGALLIGFIQAYNEGLTWHMPGSDWTQSIVFSILILILVFRPEGLLGERTPEGA